ncbi:MAG: glycine cleavage system protein H [Spirochaetales bacterium]
MKLFSLSGEWVEAVESGWRVGLSVENVSDLGDVTFIELPLVGTRVAPDSPAAVIEAVKAATDFHPPVSGTVRLVNAAVSGNPGLLNQDPEGEAWLIELANVVPGDLEPLLTEVAWRAKVHRE